MIAPDFSTTPTTNYRNPRHIVGAGTIATALSGQRFTDAVALAVKANDGEALAEWRDAKTKDWFVLDPLGPINARNGRNVRRKRWDTAYRSHCQYFGFEYGTVWLPCYICGQPFDAWTMDVEHLGGRLDRGTYPGGILLSCSGCNTTKGDGRRLPWQIAERVAMSAAARVGYSQNGAEVDHNWLLRTRREDGSEQSSTPRW